MVVLKVVRETFQVAPFFINSGLAESQSDSESQLYSLKVNSAGPIATGSLNEGYSARQPDSPKVNLVPKVNYTR